MTLTAEWLPVSRFAPIIGRCEDRARRGALQDRWHAHRNLPGNPAGCWFMRRDVAESAAAGVPLERQVLICGCKRRGWSPPPLVLGFARRSRTSPS